MSSEQIGHAQHWIKAIYLGLMRRTPKVVKKDSKKQDRANKDGEESGEDEAQNSENEEADGEG